MSAHDHWASRLDPELDAETPDVTSPLPDREAAALDRIGAILADESVWGEPPADLRAGLLAQAAAEAEAGTRPGAGPEVGAGVGGPAEVADLGQRRAARNRRLAWMGSGLVAAAAAVALFFVAVGTDDDGAGITTFEVAGTDLTPDLDATVDIEPRPAGVAITLHIAGLGPAGDGRYYAGWLVEDGGFDGQTVTGDVVGVGSFHWRMGGIPIELWSGVDTDRYPLLVVTLQDEGGPPTPSDVVVMTARVDGP